MFFPLMTTMLSNIYHPHPNSLSHLLETERAYLNPMINQNVNFTIFDVPIDNNTHIHTIRAKSYYNVTPTHTTPILLLHGFTGSLGNWRDIIPLLTQQGYEVYAIDMLGWGFSSRPQTFPNWEIKTWLTGKPKYVDDVCDFWVDSLEKWRYVIGLTHFHIVGFSLGGWVAGEYVLRYPENIEKLTLANSVGVYKHDKTWFSNHYNFISYFMETTRFIFGINWPFQLIRNIDWLTRHQLFNILFGKKDLLKYTRAVFSLPPSGEIVAEYIRRRSNSNDSHVLWDRLPQIRCPIHLLYSEADTTVPPYDNKILSQLPNSPLIEISKIGYGAKHTSQDPKVIEAFTAALQGGEFKTKYMKDNPNGIVQSDIFIS